MRRWPMKAPICWHWPTAGYAHPAHAAGADLQPVVCVSRAGPWPCGAGEQHPRQHQWNHSDNVVGIGYTNGKVRAAFRYDGSTSLITVPPSPSLAVSNLTIDAWVFSTDDSTPRPLLSMVVATTFFNCSMD